MGFPIMNFISQLRKNKSADHVPNRDLEIGPFASSESLFYIIPCRTEQISSSRPMGTQAQSTRLQALRLYRRALRWAFDWNDGPDDYRARCVALRAEFDRHASLRDPGAVRLALDAGEHALWIRQHPEPFVYPSAPGGVAWQRHAKFSRKFALHGYNPNLETL